MNLNILKALSVPGFVSDRAIIDLLHYQPDTARIVSDLCIGSGNIATPVLRLGGIDVVGVNNTPAVVLSTPEGMPVCQVDANHVTAYHTRLLERGDNRETVVSARPSYIVKRVREKIGAMCTSASFKHSSMFISAVSQVADYYRSRGNQSQTMSLSAQTLYNLTNAITNSLPIDTALLARIHTEAESLINSKSSMLRSLRENLIDKKWWFIACHGDYGFAVYKPKFSRLLTPEVITDGGGRVEVGQSELNLVGWYKSLAHMQEANPAEYNNFYVQLVMTKQMAAAVNKNPYGWDAPKKSSSLFGRLDAIQADFDLRPFCPGGDFYLPEASLASWTYSETNAKTGAYSMMECIE